MLKNKDEFNLLLELLCRFSDDRNAHEKSIIKSVQLLALDKRDGNRGVQKIRNLDEKLSALTQALIELEGESVTSVVNYLSKVEAFPLDAWLGVFAVLKKNQIRQDGL